MSKAKNKNYGAQHAHNGRGFFEKHIKGTCHDWDRYRDASWGTELSKGVLSIYFGNFICLRTSDKNHQRFFIRNVDALRSVEDTVVDTRKDYVSRLCKRYFQKKCKRRENKTVC